MLCVQILVFWNEKQKTPSIISPTVKINFSLRARVLSHLLAGRLYEEKNMFFHKMKNFKKKKKYTPLRSRGSVMGMVEDGGLWRVSHVFLWFFFNFYVCLLIFLFVSTCFYVFRHVFFVCVSRLFQFSPCSYLCFCLFLNV